MVRQYTKLMNMEGVDLTFTQSALRELAHIAHTKGTGARGLRAILEHVMLDVMYDVPMKGDVTEFRVTKPLVQRHRRALGMDEEQLRRIA
jgi:ATP-dependent Clp protease ATP-binding subunit ClpX